MISKQTRVQQGNRMSVVSKLNNLQWLLSELVSILFLVEMTVLLVLDFEDYSDIKI